jgi:HK97 family phage major capsid protein
MGKKIVKIDGKTFIVDSETKSMEEVVLDEEKLDEEKKDEEVEEEKIKDAAKDVVAGLGIDKIFDELSKINSRMDTRDAPVEEKKAKGLLDLEALMKKDIKEMTVKEKVVGFFQAMIQNNTTVLKALSEGTPADGGYLFPDEFRAEIIRDIAEGNYMRNEVRIVPMTRDVMKAPTLATKPKVVWTAENAAKSTTTAAFNEATLTVKKMAAILYASDELIEDSTEIDVVSFIVDLFAEAIGEEEDRVIWLGNGTTQPTGIVTARAAGTIGSVTCSGNLSFDNIISLIYALPKKYHKNAKFYVHRTNIKELRTIKESTSGKYIWSDPGAPGLTPTIFGYPVVESNELPESEIYFGDLKQAYWFGDRKKMSVKISNDTETAFTHDQTAIRVVERIAGNVVLGNAAKALISIP